MKRFFKTHQEYFLIFLAGIFTALIASLFAWGIGELYASITKANHRKPDAATKVDFNLEQAKKLLESRNQLD